MREEKTFYTHFQDVNWLQLKKVSFVKISWITQTIDDLLGDMHNRQSIGSHGQQMICWITHIIYWIAETTDDLLDHTYNRQSIGLHRQQMICWIIHNIDNLLDCTDNRWSDGSHRQGSKRVNPHRYEIGNNKPCGPLLDNNDDDENGFWKHRMRLYHHHHHQ